MAVDSAPRATASSRGIAIRTLLTRHWKPATPAFAGDHHGSDFGATQRRWACVFNSDEADVDSSHTAKASWGPGTPVDPFPVSASSHPAVTKNVSIRALAKQWSYDFGRAKLCERTRSPGRTALQLTSHDAGKWLNGFVRSGADGVGGALVAEPPHRASPCYGR